MFFKKIEDKIIDSHKKLRIYDKKIQNTFKSGGLSENKKKSMKAMERELQYKKYKHETDFVHKNNHLGLYFGLGIDLHRLDISPILIPWEDVTNHSVVYGTTRVGKTKLLLNCVRQNILKGDDVCIIEPKGGIGQEVFNKLVEFASESKRISDILFVNPLMPNASEYFNPIYGLGDDEIASLIASVLYPNPNDGDSQFYSAHAFLNLKSILYALSFLEKTSDSDGDFLVKKEKEEYIKYLKIKEFKNQEVRFFDSTSGMILPDIAERVFSKIDGIEEESRVIFNRSFVTFKDIFYYTTFDNLVSLKNTVEKISISPDNKDYLNLQKMKEEVMSLLGKVFEAPKEHHAKVSVSLSNFLASISTGLLGQLFCTVRINPLLMRLVNPDRGMILLIQPAPLKIKKVAEFVNKLFIKMFESAYGTVSVSGRALSSRRLWLHLDEGESAIYPGVETLLNKAAGLGLTINIYTQSLADLKSKLGDTVAQIAQDSLNTYIIMRMNDPKSIESVIDIFGDENTIETSIVGGEGGERISFSRSMRNVLTRESVRKLRVGECFLKNKSSLYRVALPIVPDRDPKYIIEAEIIDEELTNKRLFELEKSFNFLDEVPKETIDNNVGGYENEV